jgi:predicted phosphate transport protein (TIGR00153 family)
LTSISEWFGRRREEKVVEMIKRQLELASKSIDELIDMVVKNKQKFDTIKMLEKEADDIRRDVMSQLAKGELESQDREDLMNFTKEVDSINDWICTASRNLSAIGTLRKSEQKLIEEMCKNDKDAIGKLNECMDSCIGGDKEKAMELTHKVERVEEAVDDQYYNSKKLMLKENRPGAEAVLTYALFQSVENIADACENTADQIRMILVKFW